MCGISGFIAGTANQQSLTQADLERMSLAIQHRGPDEDGIWMGKSVGLASRRLVIRHESGGKQPFVHEATGIVVVFNGEIYNLPELVSKLENSVINLPNTSEVAVIAELYLTQGVDFIKAINGMFAIAIFDPRDGRLVLLRDRLGMKPLYWAVHQDTLRFASEIKSLFSVPGFHRVIDDQAMQQTIYLSMVLDPVTPFKGVYALPAGHHLIVQAGTLNQPLIRSWWPIEQLIGRADQKKNKMRLGDAAEDFGALLSDAVGVRLTSDVPVATALSGGLDSSSIAALVAGKSQKSRQTFSINFANPRWDETEFQREVILALGLKGQSINYSDIVDLLHSNNDEALWYNEYPDLSADQDAVLRYFSRLVAERGYKVLLTGEGADELLGGYDYYNYFPAFMASLNQSDAPRNLHIMMDDDDFDEFAASENEFLTHFGFPGCVLFEYFPWRFITDPGQFKRMQGEIFKHSGQGLNRINPLGIDSPAGLSASELIQLADIKVRLPNYLLRTLDKSSMASSLEVRCPFLDHRLFEWYVGLPAEIKYGGPSPKALLRETMMGRLPPLILDRHKQGFVIPARTDLYALATKPVWLEKVEAMGSINMDFVTKHFSLLSTEVGSEDDLGYFRQNVLQRVLLLAELHRVFVSDQPGRFA